MRGIVIIGAGHGGTQAAVSLREQGYAGPVTLVSADADFPYHKPPLSKSFMKTPDAALQPLRGPSYFDENDITALFGVSVAEIDRAARAVTLSDGTVLEYEALILATGTVARRLTVPGADLGGVHHLRTAGDASALRSDLPEAKRAVIIGGGFIGLEAAAMLAARGLAVTVVELAGRLLGRAASAPIAEALRGDLEDMGVRVLTDTGVDSLAGKEGRVSDVVLGDGQRLACDIVLVGIGAQPSTALAESAELALENGIRVNETLTTSDPAIYAIGDCCSFPDLRTGQWQRLESVQNATDQGRALARILTGNDAPYDAVPWFWSDIGETKLQIAGLPRGSDRMIAVQDEKTGRLRAVYHLEGGDLRAVETLNSAGEHMLARKMLALGKTPDAEMIAAGNVADLKAYVMGR